MKRNARWLQLLTALSLAATVGCAEDLATGNDQNMLDQGEAAELGSMLITSLTELAEGKVSEISSNAALAPAGEQAVAMDRFKVDWKQTTQCSPAGSAEVEGEIEASYDRRSREAEAAIEAEVKHEDCEFAGKESTFMISGNPGIKFKAELRTKGDKPMGEQMVSLEGGFEWIEGRNREGICEIDIVGTASADGRSQLSGGFCGHSFNVEAGS